MKISDSLPESLVGGIALSEYNKLGLSHASLTTFYFKCGHTSQFTIRIAFTPASPNFVTPRPDFIERAVHLSR